MPVVCVCVGGEDASGGTEQVGLESFKGICKTFKSGNKLKLLKKSLEH